MCTDSEVTLSRISKPSASITPYTPFLPRALFKVCTLGLHTKSFSWLTIIQYDRLLINICHLAATALTIARALLAILLAQVPLPILFNR